MPRGKASPVSKQLAMARRSLRELQRALERLAAQARQAGRDGSGAPTKPPRRKLALSPARTRALQLHGRYLGYMRQLKPRAKAKVRAIRARKGVKAAIARARKLAGK